jgi:hypothetical protein
VAGIHIKPSHKGLLHEALGIAKNKKIPGSKLKTAIATAKRTGNVKEEKQAVFAQNAKKWKH